MPNHHRHHGKRKHTAPQEEPQVDDLLIASMAVASAWSPPPVENTDSSDDGNDDDDGSSSNYCKDAHEILLEDELDDATKTSPANNVSAVDNDNTEKSKPINEESDDESDIDLTDNLAAMEDDDDIIVMKKKDNNNASSSKTTSFGIYEGPKTEHEIDDPYSYQCPIIDELEKLNVGVVGTTTTAATDKSKNGNNNSSLDEAITSKLRIAGVIRSYLVEQRTIVVDSLIPSALQSSVGDINTAMNNPLDEGSVMAVLLRMENNDKGACEISTSLSEANSVQLLGKVVEVFGPVQRPLYVIRLPEPPKVEVREKAKGKQSSKQSGDEIKSETKCSTAQVDESTVAHETKVADGEIKDTGNEQDLEGEPILSSTTCEKRKVSDLSTEVEDPWCVGGKVSTILRNTPNAVVYSVIDHSTVINKDQIIKISGKGCGKSVLGDCYFTSNITIDLIS